MSTRSTRLFFVFVIVASVTALCGADWKQFRGASSSGAAADGEQLPLRWSDQENTAWRAELPGRGPSGPIVVDDRVIVTCSSGYHQDRLHVLAFDTKSGQKLWERQFWATGRTRTHPSSANAAPTPASDGEFIYAFYSSNDLICLDLDGNLVWYRGLAYDFPKAGNDIGMASSPVVIADTVVVQIENQGDSFVTGINTRTGESRWRLKRPNQANWSSPVVIQDVSAAPIVLVKSSNGLDAHHAVTGERLWTHQVNAGDIPSVATRDDLIFLPANGMTILQLRGGKQSPHVVWASPRLRPGTASPIVLDNKIYLINRSGVLTCADLEQQKVQWQLRLKGTFWATPVLANGYLYCINDAGSAQVVSTGDQGKLVATSEFGETIQASPAVADNGLYVRSDKYLWKISSR